ncbi:MAG: hypothetical protein ACFE0O_04555 [Opitutales bacterium]
MKRHPMKPETRPRRKPHAIHRIHVWEWTSSTTGPYPGGTVSDWDGPHYPSDPDRVVRSGGPLSPARVCRSAYRGGAALDVWGDLIGFRVALRVG